MLIQLFLVSYFVSDAFSTSVETVKIIPTVSFGIWEGWGCSFAWWAKIFGNRDDVADLFFTNNYVAMNGASLPGLNLNIFRYNAGASSWNKIDNTTVMEVSPNMIESRQIEGYQLDWYNADTSSASWDWSVDANQRNMLQKAKLRQTKNGIFELFSNSPMWWMLVNKNPSGSNNGKDDNLQTWNFIDYANYLTSIASYFKQNLNILFQYVEPFNEPMSNWWTATNNQEGCHFSTSAQTQSIQALAQSIADKNLGNDLQITSSDENTYTIAISTYEALKRSNVIAQVKKVNVHGYEYETGAKRSQLYNEVVVSGGKKLWNSEHGDGDASGQDLIRDLNWDFQFLHMTGWAYWQVLDGGGWGLLDSDLQNAVINNINKKYYVFAHYTRHILVGDSILSVTTANSYNKYENSVVSYNAAENRVSIVSAYANTQSATSIQICFDLSQFKNVTNKNVKITRWNTDILNTSNGDNYKQYSDVVYDATNKQFCSTFEPNSIQSFDVTLA